MEVYDIKLKGVTKGLRLVIDSLGFFLAEKVKVLLDNETAKAWLEAGIPNILDHVITTEFNGIRTGVEKLVKVR